jgi:hypothetical protein
MTFMMCSVTLQHTQYNEAPQITVTQNGVCKLLYGLSQHKATGPDEIWTKFLKEMAAPVTPALTFIFQEKTSLDDFHDVLCDLATYGS